MIWIQTASGRAFDLLDPRPELVDFGDIAHSLARISRFTGHTAGVPYSVAQHSVMGSDAIMGETGSIELGAWFLLHDAHETYVGDLATPVKDALHERLPGFGAIWGQIRRDIDDAIHLAAGLPLPLPGERHAIGDMDIRMLRAERDALLGAGPMRWHADIETAPLIPGLPPIEPWGHEVAELMFRNRLEHFFPERMRAAAAAQARAA